jgi:hypothetical protein
MAEEHIKVGVGLLVLKDGKVLIGKRKGSFGQESTGLSAATWSMAKPWSKLPCASWQKSAAYE